MLWATGLEFLKTRKRNRLASGAAGGIETDNIGVSVAAGAVETESGPQGIVNNTMVLSLNVAGELGDLARSGGGLGGLKYGDITAKIFCLDGGSCAG